MDSKAYPLHVFFFPFMAQGHIIPLLDVAKLFSERGAKVGVVATPLNAAFFRNTIDRTPIETHLLEFSPSKAGLPDGCENLDTISSSEMFLNFMTALDILQEPLERLVQEHHPDCIVSDTLLPWTVDVADKFSIPRLVFTGSGFFPLCISNSISRYAPHENVAADSDAFIVPGLPHPIELTLSQIPGFVRTQKGFIKMAERAMESDRRSFGIVMNTFYELEPAYVEHYKKEMGGRNSWLVGPVSLYNRNTADAAERGKKACVGADDCSKWLDAKPRGSVVYICFGSLCRFSAAQLLEIALAMEESERPFIWVVGESDRLSESGWLPDGYEERTKEKGLVLRGWAPQVLILNHPSVGLFVTHCGWNSILEGVCAGVAMVTWPLFAEQFYNEKLVTHVLKIGVPVGSTCWVSYDLHQRPLVGREGIDKAVNAVMDGGDEAEGMRKRAKELREMAWRAVRMGGSSYLDMSRLIGELEMYRQKADSSAV